jgi:hypothetical protein
MRKRRLTFWTTLFVLIPLLLVSGIAQAQDGRRPAAKTSEDVPDLLGDDFGKGQKKARGGADHENHPPTLSVRWDPPQPKLGKTVLNPNGRPSILVIYAEGKDPDNDDLTYTFKSLDTGQIIGPTEQNWICMWPGDVTYGLFREEITVTDEHGAKTSVILRFMVMSESFDDVEYKKINTVTVEGTQGLSIPSQFYCPSPIFGRLMWSGKTPKCPEGFTLMSGSLFRLQGSEQVCVRCPPNCTFVEDKDRMLICVVAGSGRFEGAPATPTGTAREREQRLRQQMKGNWKWFSGTTVTINENGTFSAATGQRGTWRITDAQKRTVKMEWAKDPKKGGPWYDDLTLSEDGRSIEGYNQNRTRVTGTKTDGPAAPRIYNISGTWRQERPGADVITITGGTSSYSMTGTNGSYKNQGTIKGDGTKFEGSFKDVPGFCCGRDGYVWLEVVDGNTFRARSVWWTPGRSSKEKPDITHGWSTWKRSAK